MRQLIRLVRYVLPFLAQLLPGIFLLAGLGFLKRFGWFCSSRCLIAC